MTTDPTDIAETVRKLRYAAQTAQNDDLSKPYTEKRTRHIARYEAMHEAADALEQLAAEHARSSEQAAQGWQPIETAPKSDRRIRVWTWNAEYHARWNADEFAKKPRPYWSIIGFSTLQSRDHQPLWWMPCASAPSAPVSGSGQP